MSKYHSFLESLHVMHSIRNMKGTAGGDTVQSSSIWYLQNFLLFASRPLMAFWLLHDLDSTKLIYNPILLDVVSPCGQKFELIVWEGRGDWKESHFRLSLPRARRDGDRILHLLMLVTPKPHRTLREALSLCSKIHCHSGDDWTDRKIWRTRVDQSPTRTPRPLWVPQAHCLPAAGSDNLWNRRWAQKSA